jgi:hypothetical protein
MLIDNGDGSYMTGPLDVLCILHDQTTGRFHPAFFEEAPFPGPRPDLEDLKVVRLKSKMHHTEGAATLEEAMPLLDELAGRIRVRTTNIWRDPRPWDGQLAVVWLLANWLLQEPKAAAHG